MSNDPVASLWEDELEPWLDGLEAEQAAAKKRFFIFGTIGVLMGVVLAFYAASQMAEGGLVMIAMIAPVVAGLVIGGMPLNALRKRVKSELLDKIAAVLGLHYAAKPPQPARFEQFRRYGLLPSYTRRSFEDHFEGQLHGADFELYEAHLEQKRQSGKSTHYVTVFRGVLIRIGYPRTVEGVTVITRDQGWFNGLSALGRSFGSNKLERIGLVDPEFERIFEVYGDDQVSARYMLTPSFMERLLKLETSLQGKNVRAVFDADSGVGELLIAAETGNQFEVNSVFNPLPKRQRVMDIVDEIKLIAAIIDDLVKPASESGEFDGRD